MYSPEAGEAACELSANIDNNKTSKKRFIVISERTIYAGCQITQVALVAAVADRALRHRSCRLQPTGFHLPAHQIFPCLPFSNHPELITPNQCFRGERTRIII